MARKKSESVKVPLEVNEEKKKRIRRSGEELVKAYDEQIEEVKSQIAKEEQKLKDLQAQSKEKIKKLNKKIKTLEDKKESALNPKPRGRKADMTSKLINLAKKNGLSEEEIAEKLGLTFEE